MTLIGLVFMIYICAPCQPSDCLCGSLVKTLKKSENNAKAFQKSNTPLCG